MAAKAISSPVPVEWYPTLAVVMVSVGLMLTASFFIYPQFVPSAYLETCRAFSGVYILKVKMNGDYCSSSSRPHKLPLHYIKEITNNFSDVIGTGGFGVVYKGVQPNGVIVAVKKLLHSTPNSLEQLENEVHHLMRLEHPNILRLIGYCYDIQKQHFPYEGKHVFIEETELLLCLEYLPSGSLDRFLSDPDKFSRVDWHKRYKIIEGVCKGLQYLHEETNGPIIHLDLNPANILLDDALDPKIADFGLSRLLDRQEIMYTIHVRGTPGYMSPEHHQGILTPMSDIFSLGVIIVYIVMGERWYPADISTSSEEFIELGLQKWRNKLTKEPGCISFDKDCQQIRRCIQIGLMCMDPKPDKRPTATRIIKMLEELEGTDCNITNEEISPEPQSGPRELLDIYPRELSFSCMEPDRRICCLVELKNITDKCLAFHFKATSATNNYCIEPADGFLRPLSMTRVVVTMEEIGELLPSDLQFNDEFLVQSIIVREHRVSSEHVPEDTFNMMTSNGVHKVKLSVVHVPPTQATIQDLVQHSEATLDAPQVGVSQDNSNAATGFVKQGLACVGSVVIVHSIWGGLYKWTTGRISPAVKSFSKWLF